MELKNVRFISLSILLVILGFRIFLGPLGPENLTIETEDKIYLIQAGEPWGLYFKHDHPSHPYLDIDAIVAVRLENENRGLELSIGHIKSLESVGVSQMTYVSILNPFSSIETPLLLSEPRLIFQMIDGRQLSFQLGFVGFYPEREQRSTLQINEIYGLYQEAKPGLHGLYMTVQNPTALTLCMTHLNLGLKPNINREEIFQTPTNFIPHQAFESYQKKPFDGCFKPFTSTRLLIHQPLESVLESVVISLYLNGEAAYLNPIRLVRNIPFHHHIDTIKGHFHD